MTTCEVDTTRMSGSLEYQPADDTPRADAEALAAAWRAADATQMRRLASRMHRNWQDRAAHGDVEVDEAMIRHAREVEQAVLDAECELSELSEQVEELIRRCQRAAQSAGPME